LNKDFLNKIIGNRSHGGKVCLKNYFIFY